MSHYLRGPQTAALGLLHFAAEDARPILESLYGPQRGGSKRRDPVVLLRTVTTMVAMGPCGVNTWVARLRMEVSLRALVGLAEDEPVPAVATLYSFLYRLGGRVEASDEGPARTPRAESTVRSHRRRGSFQRHLADEKEGRAEGPDAASKHLAACLPGIESAPPDGLFTTLNRLLELLTVMPSMKRGLIDPHAFLAMDGCLISSQASPTGHRPPGVAPAAPGEARPAPPNTHRMYSDPTATWSRSAAKDSWIFGHRMQLIVARMPAIHLDLPIYFQVGGAHAPDVVMGVDCLVAMEQLHHADQTGLTVAGVAMDKAYDATAIFELSLKREYKVYVPSAGPVATDGSSLPTGEKGHPICPGGKEMRKHGHDKRLKQDVFNCPCKRPTKKDGKYTMAVHIDECPLKKLCEDTLMGPLVRIGDVHKHRTELRAEPDWSKQYNKRTAVERVNGQVQRIVHRATRRRGVLTALIFLTLLATHIKAWGRQELEQAEETLNEALNKTG